MTKSWLSDNIRSVLALLVTLLNFLIMVMVISGIVHCSESTQAIILGTCSNIEIIILGYFFGSSKDKPITNNADVK